MGATEFDELLVQAKAALNAIINGDPSGYKAIYSEGEDITLGNPFGGFGRGKGELLLIDDLSRHGIDHLCGLSHSLAFRSGHGQP